MSQQRKLDAQTSKELRSILARLNISQKRIIIDFEQETIESYEDYSIDDILEVTGMLNTERSSEVLEEIKRSRNE